MRNELDNAYEFGRDEYPRDLTTALTMASRRKLNGRLVDGQMKDRADLQGAAFVVAKSGRPDRGSPQQKGKGMTCWFCDEEGHTRGPACKKLQKAAIFFQKNPPDDFMKKVKEGGFVTVNITGLEEIKVKEGGFVTVNITGLEEIILTGGDSLPFGVDDLNIDNQASLSLFHNRRVLTNVRKTDKPIRVSGVGKAELVVDHVGDFLGIGPVYWHPDAIANLLCFHDMNKKFGVKFHNNCFSFKANGLQFDFPADGKFYICNMKKFFPSPEVMAVASSVDFVNTTEEVALVETVAGNLSKLTKREVELAEEARRLFSVVGRPSLKDFTTLVRSNLIKHCPITVEDISRAITIWGNDIGAVVGRTTRKKPLVVDDTVFVRHNQEPIVLYMDILFINGLSFLIAISKGFGLITVRYIDDRKKESAKQAILDVFAVYSRFGCKVTTILWDGEGAVSSLKTTIELLGVQVEQCAKNEHVPTIERAIRQLKERVRAYWNTLPFKLTHLMLIHLVYHLVIRINQIPRSTSAIEGVSPYKMNFIKRYTIRYTTKNVHFTVHFTKSEEK
jgi:hypothetical protein